MAKVTVDIVSDVVCPWCWLGHRYWSSARELAPEIETETFLRPFQLDPTVPRAGVGYRDYMKAKFGGGASDHWNAMRTHLEAAAPEAGIAFRFDEIPTRPNTLDAHRLIRWAQGQGLGEAAADRLFKAFFAELRDVGDRDVLIDLADEIGLHRDVVTDLLAEDRDVEEVQRQEQLYRSLGVTGVPCFIFNGRFAIAGAQAPEMLADALRKAAGAQMEDAP